MDSVLYDPLKALLFSAVRLQAMFIAFSLLQSANVKGVVRMALVICLAGVVTPLVYAQMPRSMDLGWCAAVIAKEALLGWLMGFAANQVFWAVQSLGSLLDQQTGIGMASVIDPVSGHQDGPTPGFLNTVMVNLLVSSGAFLGVLGAVFESYRNWPVFSYWPSLDAHWQALAAGQASLLAQTMVCMAAPLIGLLLLVELGLGLLQRYLTTLNVNVFSQSLKIGMATFMLMLMLVSATDTLFDLQAPERAVRQLKLWLEPAVK